MAACKRVSSIAPERDRVVKNRTNPESYYAEHPAWNFHVCDSECWSLSGVIGQGIFFSEIFPFLQQTETRTWSEILVQSEKQNHPIDAKTLNPAAQKRLVELHLELDSVISLRMTATHRIYGFMVGKVFHILWIDTEHGDNGECVCRSLKKHT